MKNFMSIVQAVAVVLGLVLFDESEGHGCPPQWTGFGSSCYKYHSAESNWIQASLFCADLTPTGYSTARLASVHSQDQQDFLNNYWLNSRNPIPPGTIYSDNEDIPGVWIGLNDISTEGHFQWTDVSPYDYSNWLPGEPNNCCGGEDATHLWDHPQRFGGWNDVAENNWVFPSFCQINL